MNVLLIGASDKPERFAYKALRLLQDHGHVVFPIHPRLKDIEGTPVYASMAQVPVPIDTVTLYIGPDKSAPLESELLALAPKRVIFNPGTENPALMAVLTRHGISCLESCTLVLLNTHQF
jgi:uncharacterized protein